MRALLAMAVLTGVTATPSFELPEPVTQLFAKAKWDGTPKAFRIIALSHLADGCVAQAKARPGTEADARACVERTLSLALALRPNDDGLFLSHVNLIYGAADALGPCLDPREHERVSRELARRSLADPHLHAASYATTSLRWPADQSVTLAGLARFDAAHDGALLTAPLEGWRREMSKRLDPKTGLPVSEVTGRGPGAKYPRGCANSYLVRYVGEFDSALATTWWAAYRKHFLVRVGPVVGFREWPVGVERRGDVDSGPIVFGVGTAASAFAIAAAKSRGDFALAGQLEANKTAVLATGAGGPAAETVLAAAISFHGAWQQSRE